MGEAELTTWELTGRILFVAGWAIGFLLAMVAGLRYRKPGVSFSELRMLMKGPTSVFEGPGVPLMNAAYGLAIAGTIALIATGTGGSTPPTGESDVTLKTRDGNLAATLLMPETPPRALALLIAGSGPTDRDGNGPGLSTDSLKLLAEALAEAGIASLRGDKRGVAGSTEALRDEAELRFETYVEDAAAWLAWSEDRLPGPPRVLVGHSEGALVATLAAQRQPAQALVLLAARPGRGGTSSRPRRSCQRSAAPPWISSRRSRPAATSRRCRPSWPRCFDPASSPICAPGLPSTPWPPWPEPPSRPWSSRAAETSRSRRPRRRAWWPRGTASGSWRYPR